MDHKRIPGELWGRIFCYLPIKDRCKMRRVDWFFYSMVNANNKWICPKSLENLAVKIYKKRKDLDINNITIGNPTVDIVLSALRSICDTQVRQALTTLNLDLFRIPIRDISSFDIEDFVEILMKLKSDGGYAEKIRIQKLTAKTLDFLQSTILLDMFSDSLTHLHLTVEDLNFTEGHTNFVLFSRALEKCRSVTSFRLLGLVGMMVWENQRMDSDTWEEFTGSFKGKALREFHWQIRGSWQPEHSQAIVAIIKNLSPIGCLKTFAIWNQFQKLDFLLVDELRDHLHNLEKLFIPAIWGDIPWISLGVGIRSCLDYFPSLRELVIYDDWTNKLDRETFFGFLGVVIDNMHRIRHHSDSSDPFKITLANSEKAITTFEKLKGLRRFLMRDYPEFFTDKNKDFKILQDDTIQIINDDKIVNIILRKVQKPDHIEEMNF